MSRVVKGNAVPLLTFKVGTNSAVDLGQDLINFGNTDSDGGQVTAADYANGDAGVTLELEFALNWALDGAYEYLFQNAGKKATYAYQRDSESPISQENPKWTGTCTLGVKPRWAVNAGNDASTFTTTVETDSWDKTVS